MKLKLSQVADKGNLHKERLVIRVVNDTDVGEFILMRTGYVRESVNVDVSKVFWFPDKPVKAGDLVILYTRAGTTKEKALERERTAHFFYWGSPETLWNTESTAAVLAHAPVWESGSVDDL